MPSIFANAMEGSDTLNEFHKVIDPQTLAETSAAALEEFQEIEGTGKTVDALVDDQSKVMEIQDEVEHAMEDGGLTPQAQRILKKSLTAIIGRNLVGRRLPAMENFEGHNRVYATAIALEGIMQTVKDFWTAIKNQVTQFWNKTKSWYIKTFDVSNKIIARAKAVNERASSIAASAKENSFEFSGIKFIAVNYQTKEANICITGYEALHNVINGAVENLSKENSSSRADGLIDNMRNMLSTSRANATKQFKDNKANGQANDVGQLFSKAITDYFIQSNQENPFKPDLSNTVQDQALRTKMNGGDDRIEVLQGDNLPGNRTLFHTAIDPKKNPGVDPIELIKADKPILGDTMAKPKEMEESADVKTLNVGQINKIATIAEEMGETILKYKKEFEARDRFFNKMMKGFDQIVRDLDGADIATESFEGFAMEGNNKGGKGRLNTERRVPQNKQPKPVTNQQGVQQAQPINNVSQSSVVSQQNNASVAGNSNSTTNASTTTSSSSGNSAGGSTSSVTPTTATGGSGGSGGNNGGGGGSGTSSAAAPAAGGSGGGTTPPVNQGANSAQAAPQPNQQNGNQPDPDDEEERKAVDAVDKYFRRLVGALTGDFRRNVSYQGQLITMGIKSSNAFLSYAEQSLSQYGV